MAPLQPAPIRFRITSAIRAILAIAAVLAAFAMPSSAAADEQPRIIIVDSLTTGTTTITAGTQIVFDMLDLSGVDEDNLQTLLNSETLLVRVFVATNSSVTDSKLNVLWASSSSGTADVSTPALTGFILEEGQSYIFAAKQRYLKLYAMTVNASVQAVHVRALGL